MTERQKIKIRELMHENEHLRIELRKAREINEGALDDRIALSTEVNQQYEEIKRLRAENEELHRRITHTPSPEHWQQVQAERLQYQEERDQARTVARKLYHGAPLGGHWVELYPWLIEGTQHGAVTVEVPKWDYLDRSVRDPTGCPICGANVRCEVRHLEEK